MIEIKDLSVNYVAQGERQSVLEEVNLELAAGETCAIIGPSGCGKSTMLKVVAGIITEFRGEVLIDGQPVCPKQQKIGFIPQNYGLLPWKNVYDNIQLGAKLKNKNQNTDKEKLAAFLKQLGLSGLERRYPGELSGGQQQRVALARSFVLKPDLLLMDEPFSALDAITREEMQQVFLSIWRKYSVSTILVTHYVEEAVYLGQKIVVLSGTPGKVSKVIDNPHFGVENIRSRPEFFELCRELRKMIKEDWSR
ncbi:MAG: ABC transporter ATP-binding protein [Pelosinus sp.]|nr:ABC transporter ATP-binding protein [Pelosinus sp.]